MQEDYREAKKKGQKEYRRQVLSGHSPYPPVLDEILRHVDVLAEVPVGTMEIPLEMVVGTKTAGRTSAFASNFMPILEDGSEFALKWASLYDAQLEEGIRDPIKAYEFMNLFYVEEGNKRVSVSKYVGLSNITATVTRVLPRRSDVKPVRLYYEFLDYYKVAPIYDFYFSEEGYYRRFADLLGQNLTDPWPEELIEEIKAGFASFQRIYEAIPDDREKRQHLTTGDAFLIYLTVYPLDSLMNDSATLIRQRTIRLWKEILTQTNSEHISVIENPDDIETQGHLLDMLKHIPSYSVQNPLRIAFIYDRDPEKSGWTYGHELGRNALEAKFEGVVETVRFDGCGTPEALRKAIDAAIADEDEMVITTSPTMMAETLKAAIHYPKTRFMNCSLNISVNAVRTYYGRMYEAKFVMGMLAALSAENHRIGYLADYPIYGSVANINAFAIGASMMDPQAVVFLQWSSRKDIDWQAEFAAQDIKVISGPDLIRPEYASREYGIYKICDDGTIQNIAVPMWDWGRYYELIVRSVMDGKWDAKNLAKKDQALNYWWGMSAGVIDVIMSDSLPYSTVKMAQVIKNGVAAGYIHPFEGEIRSQTGVVLGADDPRLTNEQIITMNWLCDNVVGSIPVSDQLSEAGRSAAKVSGVGEAGADLRR